MSSLNDIGNLMHLYLDEIEPEEGTNAPDFLIKASAHLLNEKGGRNWIPVIVKEIGRDKYQVIGNSFIYAVAEEAGLDRVWCIIADDTIDTAEIIKVLAGEVIPKINLSNASRDEIMSALEYLTNQPGSALKTVKLAIATNRIDEAPRQYWKTLDPISNLKCGITKGEKINALKQIFYLVPQSMPKVNLSNASRDEIMSALEYLVSQPGSVLKTVKPAMATNRIDEAPRQYWETLDPIANLKCGITKGKKIDALKQIFYLVPQPMPDIITDAGLLNTISVPALKLMAQKRGIVGTSKMKKDDLVEVLSKI